MWDGVFGKGFRFLGKIVVVALPVYTWYRLFRIWARLKAKHEEITLSHDRHNCVVMYSGQLGMHGWPNPKSKKNLDHLDLYDPILHFIEGATQSLDVAVMVINLTALANALIKAHKRGVRVRVLVDYVYSHNTNAKDLQESGVEVLYYVSPDPSVCSIMHYKYMLKDYSNGTGYLYMGSLNWTSSGIQQNYENILFTTEPKFVCDMQANFEKTWSFVSDLCKNNSYVKATLHG